MTKKFIEQANKVSSHLNHVKRNRLYRTVKPKSISPTFSKDKFVGLFPPGSITLVFFRKGNRQIESLMGALKKKDERKVSKLSMKLLNSSRKIKKKTLSQILKTISEQKAIAELHFGLKTLAPIVTLSNNKDFGFMSFPYNGGKIDMKKFILKEYIKENYESDLDYIIVKRVPKLKKIEKLAISEVPEYLQEIHIGNSGPQMHTVAILFVVWVTVHNSPIWTNVIPDDTEFENQLNNLRLTQDDHNKFGSELSALELIKQRENIFNSYYN